MKASRISHRQHIATSDTTTHVDQNTFKTQLEDAHRQKDTAGINRLLDQAASTQKDFLEIALTLGIEKNDLPLVQQTLAKGANPDNVSLAKANDVIHEEITYARRFKVLYANQDATAGTQINSKNRARTLLDQKLQELQKSEQPERSNSTRSLKRTLDGGRKESGEITHTTPIQKIWLQALETNQLDLQRAILLLLKSDQLNSLQITGVKDPRIQQLMKEIPRFSAKWRLENFNGRTTFKNSDKIIVCRHLVAHRLIVQARHPQGKFAVLGHASANPFGSLESISEHVSETIEKQFQSLLMNTRETHLIDNNDLGRSLIKQFKEMSSPDTIQTVRLILFLSSTHAMSMRFRIKGTKQAPTYVVEFFDPNTTTNHVRVATENLQTLEKLTLQQLIPEQPIPAANAGLNLYKIYYPESFEQSLLFVVKPPTDHQDIPEIVVPANNRCLTSCIKDKKFTPLTIHHFLRDGFSGDLRRLKTSTWFKGLQPSQRTELLAAKRDDGVPGLYMALQSGYADTVRAFGELLKQIPVEQRADLLAARHTDGIPGLYSALQNGHADTVRAFGELLKQTPVRQRADLLAAKRANGMPGLYVALQNGHTDTIRAFGELLKQIPVGQRTDLLAARHTDGIPGLYIAVFNGYIHTAYVFSELWEQMVAAR